MSSALTHVRSVVTIYRDRDIPFLAGSVAYSAFSSIIPLILLLLIAASVFGGEAFRQTVLDLTSQYLAPDTTGVIEDSIAQAASQVGVSLLGLLVLVWSVLKVFRSLDTAFSELYQASLDASLGEQIRDGIIVFGGMTVAVLAMVAVGALVALAPSLFGGLESEVPLVRVLSFVGLVVGLTVAFLPMYYVFPDVDVTVREVLPGAALAAVGWALLQVGFQVYVSLSSASQVYGVIGGVILFLTWLYFGAVVLLLGAATNVVLAGRATVPTSVASEPASTEA